MPAEVATSVAMGTNNALTPLQPSDFDDVTLRRPGMWLIDFSTAWCPPCRVLTPLLVQLAGELKASLSIGAVDCDDEPQLAQCFGVTAMPTMLLFRDGRVIAQKVGAMPRAKLLAWLTSSGVPTEATGRRAF
jgi:thioredoxin 1